MKTPIALLCCLVATENVFAAAAHGAATATPPPCCAAENPAKPLLAPGANVSRRSLYQLDASWTNDAGQSGQLASLRGQPVVLAMFFSSCTYACPLLVQDMQRLRNLLPAEARARARFVLVSFDTARDTPAVLRAFREKSALDASWTLLRGDAGGVQELAMLLGVKFKQDANGQFSHSNLITVLNGEGEIAHQRNGLTGDVSEAAKAVVLAAR